MNKEAGLDIVCIDFDGVLANYDGWKGKEVLGEPIKGAREFVDKMIGLGYTVIVFTTRESKYISPWLEKYGFPKMEVTSKKIPAKVYIDDRCQKFEGDYQRLVEDLKSFDVHWRNKEKKIFDKI